MTGSWRPIRLALALALAIPASALAQGQLSQGAIDSEGPPVFGGWDLGLNVWESSGVVTAPEAYLNQGTIVFEPSYRLGHMHFPGTWADGLSVSARLLWMTEFAGNDPTYRDRAFASPALIADPPSTAAAVAGNVSRSIDGLSRSSRLSDLWLNAFHASVAKVPGIDADVQAGLRLSLPTSVWNWNAGMIAAPSIYLGLTRELGPVTLGYGVRTIKWFFTRTVSSIVHLDDPVVVNGQTVQPYRPESTTGANPNFGFAQNVSVDVSLPQDFSVSISYGLNTTVAHALAECSVPGVPTADVCTSGAALGDVRNGAVREDQWFNLEVDWSASDWLGLGLGLSTWTPVRMPDGSLANPFFRATRDNWTTLYLSVSTSAEAIAKSLQPK